MKDQVSEIRVINVWQTILENKYKINLLNLWLNKDYLTKVCTMDKSNDLVFLIIL